MSEALRHTLTSAHAHVSTKVDGLKTFMVGLVDHFATKQSRDDKFQQK